MEEQHIHQEVFVSTTTTLVKKILNETSEKNRNTFFSDKLEQSFWNGLLNEMFPELSPLTLLKPEKMFIWSIYTGKSYLVIDRADIPNAIDLCLSIDPHLFLSKLNLN